VFWYLTFSDENVKEAYLCEILKRTGLQVLVHQERVSLTAEDNEQQRVALASLSKSVCSCRTKKNNFPYMSALWLEIC
jgi:hypothetical protein